VNDFIGVIKQLEAQKTAIERALEALREVGGEVSVGSAPSTAAPNDKRSAGQKARWASKRAAESAPSLAHENPKGGMTPEGRKRLAEAMKRRWAAKRSATQAKRRPGRPKKVA
jgi:hypothetical protein